MSTGNDRIGLILSTITHQGTATAISAWPSFARTALADDKNLFLFPGGKLSNPQSPDFLRNRIYSLVNSDNLDGVICWTSVIRGEVPMEEVERFHAGFGPLPLVTLAQKIPGYPFVGFDGHIGMKQLILHCIKVHGDRKIAFLRGPESHPYAQERFKGYLDALEEAGISYSPESKLVTTPMDWELGETAAAQLFEERKLIPGKDFDTLVGVSDVMILRAVNYFKNQGFYVPDDYHALGFNNFLESRLTESPLSTVNVSFSALSTEAFKVLNKLLYDKKNGSSDIHIDDTYLSSEPVIRESCGCRDLLPPFAALSLHLRAQTEIHDPLVLLRRAESLTKMIAGFLKLNSLETKGIVAPLIRAWFKMQPDNSSEKYLPLFFDIFFVRLKRALNHYFRINSDTEPLLILMKEISGSDLVSPGLFRMLESSILRTIMKIREQTIIRASYETDALNEALNSLKYALLEAKDRNFLVQNLARHLPKIGINTAGLVLYNDAETSLWVGSYSPEGISPMKELLFPARQLVPDLQKDTFSHGVFIIQSLFLEDRSLGYFIHTASTYKNVAYEDVRNMLNYALKSILQSEDVARAHQQVLESTEQSRMLSIQKEAAQAASEAKSQFLANMSHEIRTPLNAITGMTRIARNTNDIKQKDNCLNKIEGASSFLLGVINDILDMSKIENNKFELSSDDFSFSAMLNRVLDIFDARMNEKDQKLEVSRDDSIPEWLRTDEQRLSQVITNLMSNANKFTPNGGSITMTIRRIKSDGSNCLLEFTISDTGIGISKEQQEKLFMPFYQIDSTISRKYQGTGLGLVISKKIVEMMGGTIRLESEEGKGSSFIFTIKAGIVANPVRANSEQAWRSQSAPNTKPAPHVKPAPRRKYAVDTDSGNDNSKQEFSGKRILLAEDVDINREIVTTILGPLGLEIVEAEDGQKALSLFSTDPENFNLIFMDIHMPGINGYETTKLIRSLEHPKAKTIPIIAMTANVFKEDVERCFASGMNGHIGKPLDFDAVIEILRKYL